MNIGTFFPTKRIQFHSSFFKFLLVEAPHISRLPALDQGLQAFRRIYKAPLTSDMRSAYCICAWLQSFAFLRDGKTRFAFFNQYAKYLTCLTADSAEVDREPVDGITQ